MPPSMLLLRESKYRESEKQPFTPCCFCLFLKGLCSLSLGVCLATGTNFLDLRTSTVCSCLSGMLALLCPFSWCHRHLHLARVDKSCRSGWALERGEWFVIKQVLLMWFALWLLFSCLNTPTSQPGCNAVRRPLLHADDMLFELSNYQNCRLNKPLFCTKCLISGAPL